MRNCLCRWHIRLPMTRRPRHGISVRVCEGIFTLILLPRGREGGEPATISRLFLSLSKVGNGINLRHTRRPRCRSAVVILGQSITTSRVFPLKKKIALFRRVSFLPRQSPSDEKEREREGHMPRINLAMRSPIFLYRRGDQRIPDRKNGAWVVRSVGQGSHYRSRSTFAPSGGSRVSPENIPPPHSLTAPPPSSICCRCRRPLILNMRAHVRERRLLH